MANVGLEVSKVLVKVQPVKVSSTWYADRRLALLLYALKQTTYRVLLLCRRIVFPRDPGSPRLRNGEWSKNWGGLRGFDESGLMLRLERSIVSGDPADIPN